MTQPTTPEDQKKLANEEARAASSLEMGVRRWILAACAALYFVALFLPFAGGANGWQLLGATEAAQEAQTKITEYAFVWLSFIGVGALTTLTVITKRFAVAVPAWMFTTVSFAGSLLAIWLRRSSSTYDEGLYHGPGIYLAILAAAVAVFAYPPILFGRNEAQREVAEQRAAAQGRDDVAQAQRAATEHAHKLNPLLIDDRRARAAERHQRHEQ